MISCHICMYDCAVHGVLDKLEATLGNKELLARPYNYDEHADMDKAVTDYLDYGGFRRDAGLSVGFRTCGKCYKSCVCHDLIGVLIDHIADRAFEDWNDPEIHDWEFQKWHRDMANRFAMNLIYPPIHDDRTWDEILKDVLGRFHAR